MILRLDVNIGTLLPDCAFSCNFFPDKLKGRKISVRVIYGNMKKIFKVGYNRRNF